MPSIRKRAMNYLDRLNLRALKDQYRKLVARASFPSHSRTSISSRPIIIGSPTNFRKDTDPFSSMIALPANREYAEREGIVISPNNTNTTSCRSQELPTTTTSIPPPPQRSASTSRSASARYENSSSSSSSSTKKTKVAQAVSTSEEGQTSNTAAATTTDAGPDLFSSSSGQYIRP